MTTEELTAYLETAQLILRLIPQAAQALSYITTKAKRLAQRARARRKETDTDQNDEATTGDTDESQEPPQDPQERR